MTVLEYQYLESETLNSNIYLLSLTASVSQQSS